MTLTRRGGDLLEAEPVAGGVQDPGVVVGALHAGVQPQRLPGQLPRGQWAGVRQGAEWLALESRKLRTVNLTAFQLLVRPTLISHFSFHSAKSRSPFRSVGCVIH